jgi:hypothetical protein
MFNLGVVGSLVQLMSNNDLLDTGGSGGFVLL